MSPWPAPARGKTARAPDDERSSLDSWLEFHRTTLLIKCAGLTPEQLVTRSCPPSPLSLLGRVRHMAEVESWFHGPIRTWRSTGPASNGRGPPCLAAVWMT